jgi:hypothetical protein
MIHGQHARAQRVEIGSWRARFGSRRLCGLRGHDVAAIRTLGAAGADDVDPLLDQFMPVYEVAERHHVHVAAPADITFAAAGEQDLMALPMLPDARTHQEPPRRSMDAARSRAVQRRR